MKRFLAALGLCAYLVAAPATGDPLLTGPELSAAARTVGIGSEVEITNGTGSWAMLTPVIGGVAGNSRIVAPGESTTFHIPNDPSLIGLEFRVDVVFFAGAVREIEPGVVYLITR